LVEDDVLHSAWGGRTTTANHGLLGEADVVGVLSSIPGSDPSISEAIGRSIIAAACDGRAVGFAEFRTILDKLTTEYLNTTQTPLDQTFEAQQAEDIFDLCESLDEVETLTRSHMVAALDDLGIFPKAVMLIDNVLFTSRGTDQIARHEFVQLTSTGENASKFVKIFDRIGKNDILARDSARFFDSIDRDGTGGIDKAGMKELIGCFRFELVDNATAMNTLFFDIESVLVRSEYADDTWYGASFLCASSFCSIG